MGNKENIFQNWRFFAEKSENAVKIPWKGGKTYEQNATKSPAFVR